MSTMSERGSRVRVGWMVVAWLVSGAGAPGIASALMRNVDNTVMSCSDTVPSAPSEPCTGTPCCTIQFAIGIAVANDVIQVAAGTYVENLTLAKNLILRGVQAGNAACDRVGVETIVAPASGVGLTLTTGSTSATIDGFTFSGGTRGIESVAGPLGDLKIFSNRFVDFTDSGAFFGAAAPSMRFEQNAIDGSSATGTSGLFHLDGNNDFDGLNFRDNCVLNGVNTYGFFADGDHNVGPSIDSVSPLIEDSRFENNRVGVGFGSQSADEMSIARNSFANNRLDGLQGGVQTSTIDSNTFAANGRYGLHLTSFGSSDPARGAQDNSIVNNCISSNGLGTACTGGSNDGTPCTSNGDCTGGGACSAPFNGAGIYYSDTQATGTISTNVATDNKIFGNFAGATYAGSETIDAEYNWWGCADGANMGLCDSASVNVDADPYLDSLSITTPCDPLAAPTATPTAGLTPTPTAVVTTTATRTATPSPTPTATPSVTTAATPSGTPIPTATATATVSATPTITATPAPTSTATLTPTATTTTTPTPTATATATATPAATSTPSATATVTGTATSTRTASPSPTATSTDPATPTSTPTPTEAPTATATESTTPTPPGPTPMPGPLDHFQCYETHRPPSHIRSVSLLDHFGPSTVSLLRGKRFCAPADKNDEDPTAPLDPDHLAAYTIKQTSPPFAPVQDFTVTNQFGTISLQLIRPDALLVPSAKSHVGPIASYTPAIDHFKCYKTRGRFRTGDLNIDDQFGSIVAAIKRPVRYCAPVDKNGEGIIDGATHLLCYQVRSAAGAPTQDPLFSLNQFGPDSFNVFGPRELCVPSTIP